MMSLGHCQTHFERIIFRDLSSNVITSIPSGAFGGLGSLTELYVKLSDVVQFVIQYVTE